LPAFQHPGAFSQIDHGHGLFPVSGSDEDREILRQSERSESNRGAFGRSILLASPFWQSCLNGTEIVSLS